MLKKKIKSYVVRVVFYRIKYAYLLRYVACLGYKIMGRGGGGGLAFPIGGGMGVENTQKSHKIQGGAPW